MLSHDDSELSDGELFHRLSHGDESAYRALFRRHERSAYRVALLMVRSVPDAEEVVGTAFMELWRRRADVRIVDGSVLPWLLTVVAYAAKNKIRGRLRYQKLLRRIPPSEEVSDHAEEVQRAVEAMRVRREVRLALSGLSVNEASVLILCVVKEVSLRDAAVVLGIPEGTVKSRLSRVKAKLRSRLHGYPAREEESEA